MFLLYNIDYMCGMMNQPQGARMDLRIGHLGSLSKQKEDVQNLYFFSQHNKLGPSGYGNLAQDCY